MRSDYVHEIFSKQTEIALSNLQKIFARIGNSTDAIFLCGTDFGTQDSLFCGPDTFDSLYLPYYKKITGWIHENTQWKVFKHSCGAVEPLINNFIEAGFDILKSCADQCCRDGPKKAQGKVWR